MGRLLLVHVTAFVITQEQCKLTPFVHKPFHNWGPELELSGSHLLPFGVHPFCCTQQPYIEEILIKTCLMSVTILSVLLQKTSTLPYWGFFVWKPLFAQLEIPVELHSFLLKVLSFELPPLPLPYIKWTSVGWAWILSKNTMDPVILFHWSGIVNSMEKQHVPLLDQEPIIETLWYSSVHVHVCVKDGNMDLAGFSQTIKMKGDWQ